MKVVITIKEAIELGIWEDIAKVTGYDLYAPVDGLGSDFEIELNEEQAKESGINIVI